MDYVKRRRSAALAAATVLAVLAGLGVAGQPAAAAGTVSVAGKAAAGGQAEAGAHVKAEQKAEKKAERKAERKAAEKAAKKAQKKAAKAEKKAAKKAAKKAEKAAKKAAEKAARKAAKAAAKAAKAEKKAAQRLTAAAAKATAVKPAPAKALTSKAEPAVAEPAVPVVSARNGFATYLRAEFAKTSIRNPETTNLVLTIQRMPLISTSDVPGLGFTVDLPDNMWIASDGAVKTCAGDVSADEGSGQIVVSNAELFSQQQQCTITVAVTSRHSGTYTLDNSWVTNSDGDIGEGITTDTLTVLPRYPNLVGWFKDDDIQVGETSSLRLSLYRWDDNLSVGTTGVAWRLTLPVGLQVASVDENECGGTVTAPVGGRLITLTGGTLPANEHHCEVRVDVLGAAGGEYSLLDGSLSQLANVEAGFGACLASVPVDSPAAQASCNPRLDVAKLAQTITFAQPAPRKVGTSTLAATASSGLTVGFVGAPANVCTVSGNVLTVLTEGSCKVTAVQAGNGQYEAAEPVAQAVEILPRPPAPPTVAGTPGESSILVTWTAPAETSGITDYVATARSGAIETSCATTTLSCVVGAVADRPYTLTVVSRGPNGTSLVTTGAGTVTATAPVIPPAPPETDLDLTTTDGPITRAEPGQDITFVGTGFAPFSTVLITIYSEPVLLGTAITDAAGDFRKLVTVPANLAAGAHTAVAQGVAPDGTARAMALDITVQADGGGGGLPVTGPGVATLLLLGVGAVVSGGTLVLAGRPRRRVLG
ncbi:DUF7933 domain-containing protein [Jidongwangia harbinensis]|uniref:DUF7933 domain-containing protein n=1 Tax=Jidongwangia harbinensis TaxID=2878561 RepID=UPI001CD93A3B|nr:hypothetical protein [Jidongwangia harbinensis]MCA2214102.1 hypothetical protein [Jidongwangia harbinensis]